MTARPAASKQRVLVVVVALIMTLAGGLVAYLALGHAGTGSGGVVGDGPTFHEALQSVNGSVYSTPGGPWFLSQVFGIASPVPTSPSVWGWWPLDSTLAACQAAFNGLTIWNGSIPLFNGTFNSGTAPFWQFVFFSNTSQQILVSTDVQGVAHTYPPVAMTSPCARYSGLGYEPWRSAWTFYKWAFPTDTPAMAGAASSAVGQSYLHWLGKAATEMFYMGDVTFGSGQPYGTQIRFFTCGTPGATGMTPGLDVFLNTFDTATVSDWYNYSIGCTPTTENLTAIPVQAGFFNQTTFSAAGSTVVRDELEFVSTGPAPFTGPIDAHGITSSLVELSVLTVNGTELPLADNGCAAWVASILECNSTSSGWYAVLLSSNGQWQGSYGETSLGPAWNYPAIPIASNESLVVILPSSLDVSGLALELTSTVSAFPLTGSTEL
jgi:hypothetical protein